MMAETVLHLRQMSEKASEGAARSYRELLDLACRKVDEIAPLNVSRAAQEKAGELGMGDLRNLCWSCTGDHKDIGGKRLFVWEHWKRAADIRDEVLALGSHPTIEQVASVLGQTRMAWILRREDVALGRKARPHPEKAYGDAGIELLYAWEQCRPVDCKGHGSRRRDQERAPHARRRSAKRLLSPDEL